MARVVMRLLGVYYIITGLWPVVNIYSFELITGPKTDDWLVKMVGLLAASIGLALLFAARGARPSLEGYILAIASALSFTAIDVIYVLNGTLLEVYLLDALLEVCIVVLLLVGAWIGRQGSATKGFRVQEQPRR
jgi:hypothetical protein